MTVTLILDIPGFCGIPIHAVTVCTTLAAPTEFEALHPTCLANTIHTTEQEDDCQNVIISTVDLELHGNSKAWV